MAGIEVVDSENVKKKKKCSEKLLMSLPEKAVILFIHQRPHD